MSHLLFDKKGDTSELGPYLSSTLRPKSTNAKKPNWLKKRPQNETGTMFCWKEFVYKFKDSLGQNIITVVQFVPGPKV